MTPAKSFETKIVIDAPVERVWAVLSDIDGWHRWNRLPFRVRGNLAPGARLWIGPGRRGWLPAPATAWQIINHERELRWGGGLPGLLDVAHGLQLEPLGDNQVMVSHAERITGPLSIALPGAVRPIWLAALDHFNRGLKAAAEQVSRAHTE